MFAAMVQIPVDWLAIGAVIALSVAVLGLLVVGGILVARDTIRQSGKWGINFRRPNCTECGEPMPIVRTPASWQQALWGGWTCPQCGLELDKWGKPAEDQAVQAKFAALKAVRDAERQRKRHGKQDDRIRGEDPGEFTS
jgi:hypothetical protein